MQYNLKLLLMFMHRGKARTFRHNLRLAVFLSFTAGLVNICGVLALGVLTTNVTGHFAYFSEAMLRTGNVSGSWFLFFILAFLGGSFVSNCMTEYSMAKGYTAPHAIAMCSEILLLLAIGIFGGRLVAGGFSKPSLACILLFTMGLQNSLVSKISNSTVRTTHLTGLFTDLGIELSQLFFYKKEVQRKRLLLSIGLRCSIIVFFFLGCVTGGVLYLHIQFKILVIASIVMITALAYDNLRLIVLKKLKRS